ncbi:MAG: sulfite oxidase-like oxidoreductase [Gemmatimonadaceae bacterium]|nr:sulfite oxidase-like oxidoreductase [Gloeobacterales cyanobacterium ES-bin-141]
MLGKFFKKPTGEDKDRVPPGQHLANGFPLMTYGRAPKVEKADWQFRVWGLAGEKSFRWDDFMGMPVHSFTDDFHCVTRWSKLGVQWTGIKVTDFMSRIELDPRAKHVTAHCYGGYTTNLSLDDFVREQNFFAFQLFGEPLPIEHGGPLRLVVPHLYAWKSAKWINGLEFVEQEQLGFWEVNGYHSRGEPWSEERYSSLF